MIFAGRLINRMLDRPPDLIIGGDAPYLRRWFVVPRNRWFNLYLHNIIRSDDDRALHDHPWWNVSIVLAGGYDEIVPTRGATGGRFGVTQKPPSATTQRMWRPPGSLVFRFARTAHRLELRTASSAQVAARPEVAFGATQQVAYGDGPVAQPAEPIQCWTLFLTGPRLREWGFWCPQGWKHWRDFTAGPNGETVGAGCGEDSVSDGAANALRAT